jgi:hypothetical protein
MILCLSLFSIDLQKKYLAVPQVAIEAIGQCTPDQSVQKTLLVRFILFETGYSTG